MKSLGAIGFLCCIFFAMQWSDDPAGSFTPYLLEIPKGFTEPNIPGNNALSQERVDLGRKLFYDPALSIDSSTSCASCHNQSLAFADNKTISPGVENRLAKRNAPTLTNVVYNPTLLFDGYLPTLEMQVLVPVQEHAELNFNIVEIGKRLEQNPIYVKMAYEAYGRKPDPYVITRAISSFERTLISGNSKFDQQVYQDKKVMSRAELRGMNLFYNEFHCAKCHSGFNFTNYQPLNNGLALEYADSGRARATHLPEDIATFKVPTLRNIAVTAPYMHDGSLKTLEEVIDHYAKGGVNHKNKSELIVPFTITKRQKVDLIKFLSCLTDTDFLNNVDFGNPFRNVSGRTNKE